LIVAGMMADERIHHEDLSVRHHVLSFSVRVTKASAPSGWSMEQLEGLASCDIDQLIISEGEDALYLEIGRRSSRCVPDLTRLRDHRECNRFWTVCLWC
jgi:hypothetical protein